MSVWSEPMVELRVPKFLDLRADPFEEAFDNASVYYDKWLRDRAFLVLPATELVGRFLATFEAFPPRQRPASFTIDEAFSKLEASGRK
jgi:arylsulfatase